MIRSLGAAHGADARDGTLADPTFEDAPFAPPAGELAPGQRVARTPYIVVQRIGEGGMGEVYEVLHEELGVRCALKVLHPRHVGRADLAARTRQEARMLASTRSAHIVSVHDLGELDDGRPFFVMELLEGRDLREELALTGPLDVRRALGLVADALDGLAATHEAGIVHRDVKLSNLFVCDDGSVKLLDFGAAKGGSCDLARTGRGVAMGTPRFMAPEQCTFGEVDTRADLYAVGLALYELIAGRGPFDELAGNGHALRFAHARRTPPPPSAFTIEPVPVEVEEAIARALAKAPADRFQTAAEMARALRGAMSGGAHDTWIDGPRSGVSRGRTEVSATFAVAAGM